MFNLTVVRHFFLFFWQNIDMHICTDANRYRSPKKKVIYDHISRLYSENDVFPSDQEKKSIMTYTHRFTCMYIGQVTICLLHTQSMSTGQQQQLSPAMIMAVNLKPYANEQQLQLVTRRL